MDEQTTEEIGWRDRLYVVDDRSLVSLLNAAADTRGYLILPRLNLPEGYKVTAVYNAPEYQGFLVRVRHPSFDLIPPGHRLPVYPADLGPGGWIRDFLHIPFFDRRLAAFWYDHGQWSRATFGDDKTRGPAGPLEHLGREAQEAARNPEDIMEFADCLMLVLDAARRAGHTFGDLVTACWKKLEVNKARKWPPLGSADPNGAVEHVKEAAGQESE